MKKNQCNMNINNINNEKTTKKKPRKYMIKIHFKMISQKQDSHAVKLNLLHEYNVLKAKNYF